MLKKRLNERLTVTLVLLFLPLIYFLPAVAGKVVLMSGDGWSYVLFLHILLGDMLAQRVMPLWNPFLFGGMPLLAAIQPGVLYPPNWLFAFLPSNWATNAAVLTTYYIALVGAYLYGRAVLAGRVAAFATAVTFTFSSFMIAHLDQTNYAAASAWLPWILLVIEKLYQRATTPDLGWKTWRVLWRWVVIGAVCVALQFFAGLPQATWHIVMVAVPYLLFSMFWRGGKANGWRFRLHFAAANAATAVCGTLLSAIQLLPTLELQRQGERAALSYERFSTISMPPGGLVVLIFPFFFGGGEGPLYHVIGWGQWWLRGYIGILALLLALVGLFASRKASEERRLVWFWASVAVIALVLAIGDHLPFGINHLLYRVPIYNLFRGAYRHTYEFTFAAAILAGYGVNALVRGDWKRVRRTLVYSSCVLGLTVIAVAILYRFFASRLGAWLPPSPGSASLANAEALVPLLLFVLSTCVLWFYARRRTPVAGVLLAGFLLLDLASYGWFEKWRAVPFEVGGAQIDEEPVKAIKSRETDLHSFRVFSLPIWPFGATNGMTNQLNATIARGLQSATGYDPMRLSRPAAIAGNLDFFGAISDQSVLGNSHRGFDLMNVKYLLRERPGLIQANDNRALKIDGILFNKIIPETTLGPGEHLEVEVTATTATELALVSALSHSNHVPNGTPVASVKLHTLGGGVVTRELLAGRDTSEWAYDRADVRASIKHERATVAESGQAEGFEGHRYLSRLTFDRAEIDYIEFDNLQPGVEVVLARMTLVDATTGATQPIYASRFPTERWRLVSSFGDVDLYENLTVRPRAWFVKQLTVLTEKAVLQTIQTGRSRNGAAFDPAETGLLEIEDFGGRAANLPPVGNTLRAEARIDRYEPNRIELNTRNPEPGFLILSENYYRGWEALIDGVKTPVYRTNHALRGIAIPSGDHRVEFVFRAPSFRSGAFWSAIGVVLLLAGAVATRMARGPARVGA